MRHEERRQVLQATRKRGASDEEDAGATEGQSTPDFVKFSPFATDGLSLIDQDGRKSMAR